MSGIQDVGTVIQILRVVTGQSQSELAERSGVRNSSISNYERGKAQPKLETLQKLAVGLGLPFGALEATQGFIDGIRQRGAGAGEKGGETDGGNPVQAIARETGQVVEQLVLVVLGLLEAHAAAGPGPEP
jgi:transcriptional regulator with XRE-family HTH domain